MTPASGRGRQSGAPITARFSLSGGFDVRLGVLIWDDALIRKLPSDMPRNADVGTSERNHHGRRLAPAAGDPRLAGHLAGRLAGF